MKECTERLVKIGFSRNPRRIFDEIESVTAAMVRDGWQLQDSCIEEGLGSAHLFFERTIAPEPSEEHRNAK
ncbi:MAG: hypothetical protein JW863_19175 [Chitinispirillaceae bacterium]|nr:hypothetical protein [Chitinispirillaceae bacterium]